MDVALTLAAWRAAKRSVRAAQGFMRIKLDWREAAPEAKGRSVAGGWSFA
jgi:hypothetical protein